MTASAELRPIAYLTGEYPKVSHTFILREAEAIRKLGTEVITCSVRKPDLSNFRGEEEQKAWRDTFYILSHAKNPIKLLSTHARVLLKNPRGYFGGLGLAMRTRNPGVKAFFYQLFYFAEAGLLADHLLTKNVRHLHNHFGNSSCSVAMLTSQISGIPFSYTMHGPAIFFEPMKWRIDEKIARAKFVACISHFCRSQGMFFSDQEHWDKLRIVHCGVTLANYSKKTRDGFGKHILFVGRLDAVKGVPLLLEAFGKILKKHPDAKLTVVGDGPLRGPLETQATEPELGSAVTFTGFRSQNEVSALMEDADMLVLPSFAEGVPVVLMEAMASRIPVIASQVAGVSELVQDGISGFVIPPGDMETLVARLDTLLSSSDLCQSMGEKGRAMVEADFQIEKEAEWLATLLNTEMLDGRLRPGPPKNN